MSSSEKFSLNQQGNITIVLSALAILIIIGGGSYYLALRNNKPSVKSISLPNVTVSPTSQASTDTSNINDTFRKLTVYHFNSMIRQYYAKNHTYPKNLADLRTLFHIDDNDTGLSSDYSYVTDGKNYQYFTTLSTGEIYKGEEAEINKQTDARVQVDVGNIVSSVNIYYSNNKRLPKTISEISTDPDLSFFKSPLNPYTESEYTYIPQEDQKGFSVSGVIAGGKEYKLDIPIDR